MSMRHYILLLCWLICPCCLSAQAPKKQMVYFDAQNRQMLVPKGASYAIETEFVDSIKAIEKWYSAPYRVREVATFSNIWRRMREGETVVYYDDGQVKRRMSYQAGVLLKMSAYYPDGKLRRHYVYAKDSAIVRKCFDEYGAPVSCDTLTQQTKCEGTIPGQVETTGVRYPAKALKLGIQGKVVVQFMVDRFGRLVSAWVTESPSPLLNEEAIAAVRRIKKWNPRVIDCDPIDTLYKIPVRFPVR